MKKLGNKYKCGNCVDVDKNCFTTLQSAKRIYSLDQSKEIEELSSSLERVTAHSNKEKIEHQALLKELEVKNSVLHKQISSSRKVTKALEESEAKIQFKIHELEK